MTYTEYKQVREYIQKDGILPLNKKAIFDIYNTSFMKRMFLSREVEALKKELATEFKTTIKEAVTRLKTCCKINGLRK